MSKPEFKQTNLIYIVYNALQPATLKEWRFSNKQTSKETTQTNKPK